MKHIIRHTTHYEYTKPVIHSTQSLRLSPREDAHQRVLRWKIAAPGMLEPQIDPYGNLTHTLTISRPHTQIEIVVTGTVEVNPLPDGQLAPEDNRLPIQTYCVQTRLTQVDDAIVEFANTTLPQKIRNRDDILHLAHAIREHIRYEPGMTDVTTAASEVLALGHGVCQDHAHLFLACARELGAPARYVSGYLHTDIAHAATHAWTDVWLPQIGWISVDVTNGHFASDCHCRLAVARDYDLASPVRGVRNGGGKESMQTTVQVQAGTLAATEQ